MKKMSAILAGLVLAMGVGSVQADNSNISAQIVGNANVQAGSGGFFGNYAGISGTNGWVGHTQNQVNGGANGNVSGWAGSVGGGANGNASATVSPYSASSTSNASSGGMVSVFNGSGMVNTNSGAGSNAQSHPYLWY